MLEIIKTLIEALTSFFKKSEAETELKTIETKNSEVIVEKTIEAEVSKVKEEVAVKEVEVIKEEIKQAKKKEKKIETDVKEVKEKQTRNRRKTDKLTIEEQIDDSLGQP